VAGVFGGHPGHAAQDFFGAPGHIGHIPERRRDDIQCCGFFRHFFGMQAKTHDTTTTRGREAEALAARYLECCGLRVIGAQFFGARRRDRPDLPRWQDAGFRRSPPAQPQRFRRRRGQHHRDQAPRIILAAQHYLAGKPDCDCRFDCVLLDGLDISAWNGSKMRFLLTISLLLLARQRAGRKRPHAGAEFAAGRQPVLRRWRNVAGMKVGDALELIREPDNRHDRNAIRVEWRGHKLGYVPRAENRAVAAAMDQGDKLVARMSRLTDTPTRGGGSSSKSSSSCDVEWFCYQPQPFEKKWT
jgi:Holliday junction resolvase-like predicted endonuclease